MRLHCKYCGRVLIRHSPVEGNVCGGAECRAQWLQDRHGARRAADRLERMQADRMERMQAERDAETLIRENRDFIARMRDGRIRLGKPPQDRWCPVCGTPVVDGRRTYCSTRCRRIAENQIRRERRR